MTSLEEYYNKFNEDKRLNSRHGRVEFEISMKYIHDYIKPGDRIADIGAGTGRYSIPLFKEGYDVTAVEYVQHNLGRLKQKEPGIKAFKGNALRLKRLESDYFDGTIFFGPMYHLLSHEEKLQALKEAKRITKPGGYIFVAYIMNEYAVVMHGLVQGNLLAEQERGVLDETFRINPAKGDLYSYVRLDEVEKLNEEAGLERIKVLSPDGPANYIRPYMNKLSEKAFEEFIKYQFAVCERYDLLGASAHIVDILRKK